MSKSSKGGAIMAGERVYCLYRVSTSKQVDMDEHNLADIPMQRKACREFAKKMGWDIIREEQENGVSGFKKSAAERDKIQLIKEHAAKGLFDILLVFMFDRLGRKSDETPFIVEWLCSQGIKVWSVNEGEQRFDSHTDRLTNYIRYWQADGESQKTAIRTRTAMEQMVMDGRWRGGIPPFGYRTVKSGIVNKRKHEVYKLEINEEEAVIVSLIFDLSANSGYGRWKIATILNERGYKTRNGGAWVDSSVGHMLHNNIYIGMLKNGSAISGPYEELRIIDDATFYKVQKQTNLRTNEKNNERTIPLNISGQSLLSGNVFCGHCKGRLTLTTNGETRKHADGTSVHRRKVRYVCYNKTRKKLNCDGQTGYTMRILDEKVIAVLHMIFDKMKAMTPQEMASHIHDKQMSNLKIELSAAKSKFDKAEKEYNALKSEIVKSIQGESKYNADILSELLISAQETLETAKKSYLEAQNNYTQGELQIQELTNNYTRILRWSEIFDESPIETKKQIASMIINKVYVYEGYRLEFEFNINFENICKNQIK